MIKNNNKIMMKTRNRKLFKFDVVINDNILVWWVIKICAKNLNNRFQTIINIQQGVTYKTTIQIRNKHTTVALDWIKEYS